MASVKRFQIFRTTQNIFRGKKSIAMGFDYFFSRWRFVCVTIVYVLARPEIVLRAFRTFRPDRLYFYIVKDKSAVDYFSSLGSHGHTVTKNFVLYWYSDIKNGSDPVRQDIFGWTHCTTSPTSNYLVYTTVHLHGYFREKKTFIRTHRF